MYNLHYGLIHNGVPALINTDKYRLPNIREEYMPKTYTLCQDGDVAFADASEDTDDVAKVVEFLNCNEKEIVCGLHTIHGRDKLDKTVKGFKGYAFSSPAFHRQMRRLAQGTKIYSVSQKNFSECFIGIPSKEEQTTIASLLSLIDERISTQNKIINNLESLIKALCHILLNKKGQNVKLQDCLTCHSSTLTESKVLEQDGIYPVYGATGIIAHTQQYDINENSILIIKDGAGVGRVQYAKGKYSVIGTLNYLTPKKNVSIEYIYYCLQIFNFDKYKVGSGIPHIYFKDYGNEYIYCPSIEKQQEIANSLSAMDEKIEIEKKILIKYTEQKKYLLSNLFI
jgi:type I restriction enzyme S subunit